MGVLFLKPIYCIRLKNILIIAFALILLCFCVCAASVSEPDGLKLYVLMYHQVSEKPSKYGNYVVSPAELENEALFFRAVRASFAMRRKTLLNGLSAAYGSKFSKDDLRQIIEDCGLPEGIRGERLGLPEFAALAKKLEA